MGGSLSMFKLIRTLVILAAVGIPALIMLKVLGYVITAIAIPILLTLLTEKAPKLAEGILRWAARRLGDPALTAEKIAEWEPELEEVEGNLSKLIHAIDLVISLPISRIEVKRAQRHREQVARATVMAKGAGQAAARDKILDAYFRGKMLQELADRRRRGMLMLAGVNVIAGYVLGLYPTELRTLTDTIFGQ
jgi:hypothetical protein